jgi:hypothetical protein
MVFGAILVAVGFVGLMINLYDIYSKAGKTLSCPSSSNCGLSADLLISHIGTAFLFLGLALLIVGAIALATQKNHK